MIATLEGAVLGYDISGSGPAVVFIGGGGSLDRRAWDEQVAALASRYTCICYDVRGIGESSPARAPFSHSEDLHALLQYLGAAPAFVAGLSVAAGVAIDLALDHPADVRGLILTAPGLSSDKDENLQLALAAGELARTNGMASVADVLLSNPSVLATADAAVRERVRALYIDNARVFTNGFESVRYWQPTTPSAADRLSSIKKPALILIGDHESEAGQITARRLADALDEATLVVVEGAGHLVNFDAPEAFTTAVARFVDAVEARR
jgi:pimeloyl-ACP methyl ester carboxylesterase